MRALAASGVVLAACASSGAPSRASPQAPPHLDPSQLRTAPSVGVAPPLREPFPFVTPFRLPHTFEPERYRARIAIGNGRFGGHIEIDGTLSESVALIWLHGVNLVVTRAVARQGEIVVPVEASPPRGDELLGLRVQAPLAAGTWTIELDYTGTIYDEEPRVETVPGEPFKQPPWALGLFRRVIGGRTYFYTQSEPIYALRIFPCIDEPDRKVPWQLTLDVDADLIAASNTPIEHETSFDAKHKRVEFAPTAPLPSYLIAFAVGPFEIVNAGSGQDGTPIRVLSIRDHAPAVAAAARLAPHVLDLVEDWVGVPFRYGKLDLVTVPNAGWGAMENPGLVTFDQDLFEDTAASWVIAHEFAHQWFGNLVTLAWWDDIWLNESFAELVARQVEEKLDQQGVRIGLSPFRNPMVLQRSTPVRRSVRSANALDYRTFAPHDAIGRGADALALAEEAVGATRFHQAVRSYLMAHADHSVTTDDLLAALTEAAGKPHSDAFARLLAGPIATIEVRLSCKGTPRLEVTKTSAPAYVCVAYDRDGKRAETCGQVERAGMALPLPSASCPTWVLPTLGGAGMYEVTWTPEILSPLVSKGWAFLTQREKLALFEQVALFGASRDQPSTFRIYTRLLAEHVPLSVSDETGYLLQIDKYVPEALRARFETLVQARFAEEAHKTLSNLAEARSSGRIMALYAIALAPDNETRRAARWWTQFAPKAIANAWFSGPLWKIAARDNVAMLERMFDELPPERHTKYRRRQLVLETLAHAGARTLPELFQREPELLDKLVDFEPMLLFRDVCDPQARSSLAALFDGRKNRELPRVLKSIDECIATRKQLEPELRSWLSSPDLRTQGRK